MCSVAMKTLGQVCVTLISFDDYAQVLGALTSKMLMKALTLGDLITRMLV